MKQKLLWTLACMGFIIMLVSPQKAKAASETTVLEEGKEYSYDLNQDGEEETLSYSMKKGIYKVFVNGKVVKKIKAYEECYSPTLQITDIDTSDSRLDLWAYAYGWFEEVAFSALYEYDGTTMKQLLNIKEQSVNESMSIRPGYLGDTDGSGTFYVVMEHAINVDSITGYHLDNIPYTLSKGKVSRVETNYYTFAACSHSNTDKTGSYLITNKKLKFKGKPSNRAKTVFTLSKKGKVTPIQMYVSKDGTSYVQFKTKAGKKGWLRCSDFANEETPFYSVVFGN